MSHLIHVGACVCVCVWQWGCILMHAFVCCQLAECRPRSHCFSMTCTNMDVTTVPFIMISLFVSVLSQPLSPPAILSSHVCECFLFHLTQLTFSLTNFFAVFSDISLSYSPFISVIWLIIHSPSLKLKRRPEAERKSAFTKFETRPAIIPRSAKC